VIEAASKEPYKCGELELSGGLGLDDFTRVRRATEAEDEKKEEPRGISLC
jgi:hypothetical protein